MYLSKEMINTILNKTVVHMFEPTSTIYAIGGEKPPLNLTSFALQFDDGVVLTIDNKYTVKNVEHRGFIQDSKLIKINQEKDKFIEFVFEKTDCNPVLRVDMSDAGWVGPEAFNISTPNCTYVFQG